MLQQIADDRRKQKGGGLGFSDSSSEASDRLFMKLWITQPCSFRLSSLQFDLLGITPPGHVPGTLTEML